MNMTEYNPTFTGVNGTFVSLNSRSQWSGIEDAPKTNYLIYHFPKSGKAALGFTAQNDRVFIENKTHFTIDYNYQFQLSTDEFLYVGLKGGGFYNNIDFSLVI
jgi:type IX secretion system PorP/SprF family membrane protein